MAKRPSKAGILARDLYGEAPRSLGARARLAAHGSVHEQLLASLWKDLLGIARVRTIDNFFDICGHSLMAVDMAARVQRTTGLSLNLLDIANGTLGTLAAGLSESAAMPPPPAKSGSLLGRLFGRR